MTLPRRAQVALSCTPYYHCVARCVRRAFLCGEDAYTGQSFEHRRDWFIERLATLSEVFTIDVCAYAVMSNHTHLVLFVDDTKAKTWSDKEVLTRWHQLFKGTVLTRQYLQGETLIKPLQQAVKATAEVYRQRLMDISWFMRVLNEDIARRANQEDNCTGRFWEGRFKSQALLDEAALAACMAYVDLNPVRANMADTPEHAHHTSIKQRVEQAKKGRQPKPLLPFVGNPKKDMPKGLPFELLDYIQLVDLTGRCIKAGKPGYIEDNQPEILTRLNISPENWLTLTTKFRQCFHGAVGHSDALTAFCHHQALKKRANLVICERLLA